MEEPAVLEFCPDIEERYVLQDVIGTGCFGVVRRCVHKEDRTVFACKTVYKDRVVDDNQTLLVDTEVIALVLQREVESLQKMVLHRHPHILRLRDVFEDDRHFHFVTELCAGGELFERIVAHQALLRSQRQRQRRGRRCALTRCFQKRAPAAVVLPDALYTEHEAAQLLRNVLDAISYIHDVQHIVHRDLKASNFMFVRPDTLTDVKIIDFGLSRVYYDTPEQQQEHYRERSRPPHAHLPAPAPCKPEERLMLSQVGTPFYVAPEVLHNRHHRNDGYDAKCDVWSVGVIAYLVLSLTLPFRGQDDRATVRLLMDNTLQASFPHADWGDRSPAAVDFCRCLLRRDPRTRPTARQALQHAWIVSHCGPQSLTTPVRPVVYVGTNDNNDDDEEDNASSDLQHVDNVVAARRRHKQKGRVSRLFGGRNSGSSVCHNESDRIRKDV